MGEREWKWFQYVMDQFRVVACQKLFQLLQNLPDLRYFELQGEAFYRNNMTMKIKTQSKTNSLFDFVSLN